MPRNSTEVGKRRTYTYKGVTYPSVTTLLKGYPQEWAIPFGAKHAAERAMTPEFIRRWHEMNEADEEYSMLRESLLKWTKAAPMERRDAAADAGTDLHAYLEWRLNGRSIDDWFLYRSQFDMVEGERAVEQFLDMYRPEPVYVESQVVSITEGYAGSFDAIVDIYGKRWLLDLKTATSYDPLAQRPSDAGGDHKDRLQLAAYRYADIIFEDDRDIGPMPLVDGALILAIPREHPQAWRPIEVDAGPETYRRFLDFKRSWLWYDQNKKAPIGEHLLAQAVEDVA